MIQYICHFILKGVYVMGSPKTMYDFLPKASFKKAKERSYYQAIYVRQGKSGHFRDSFSYEMMKRDIFDEQRKEAREIFIMANGLADTKDDTED